MVVKSKRGGARLTEKYSLAALYRPQEHSLAGNDSPSNDLPGNESPERKEKEGWSILGNGWKVLGLLPKQAGPRPSYCSPKTNKWPQQ
jgi:hypothetical protein